MKLRDYQEKIKDEAIKKLLTNGMVFLAMEMRLGKTITSLNVVEHFAKHMPIKALFVSTKKALHSIQNDFKSGDFSFQLSLINYESVHKYNKEHLDFLILDESHKIGAFPKQSKRQKDIKDILLKNPWARIIYLSGTPSPENYSQLFHQFHVHPNYGPWNHYTTFYKWAKDYVNIKQRMINGNNVNEYKDAKKDKVFQDLKKYFITYTQTQAGFQNEVIDRDIVIKAPEKIHTIINTLKKDSVIKIKGNGVILGDTPVKMLQKIHQISSGTVKNEDGDALTISTYKAEYIRDNFKGQKIAIIYVFKQELKILKAVLKNTTESPNEFQESENKIFLGQVRSVREGVKLSTADALIIYNLEFSATSYLQARQRMGGKERKKDNIVYYLLSDTGVEAKILEAVRDKKTYTSSHFRKDFLGTTKQSKLL